MPQVGACGERLGRGVLYDAYILQLKAWFLSHYSSFLIRCWHGRGDEQRIKIEHIQSGEQALLTTSAAALAWIDAHCEMTSDDHAAGTDQPVLRDETGLEG